jgi:hypothetical protein
MEVTVRGFEEVSVTVNPLEVISGLYKAELGKLSFNPIRELDYDKIMWKIEHGEETALQEVYIKSGFGTGNYEVEGRVVCRMDRTKDFREEFVEYLASLDNAVFFLKARSLRQSN